MRHIKIDLNSLNSANDDELDIHRPELRFWVNEVDEVNEGDSPSITMAVGEMIGQQLRFVDLTSDDAHRIAKVLQELARLVDNMSPQEAA